MIRKYSHKNNRKKKAFALVSVIGMGAFAIAIMFGLFPFILNAIQYESGARYISELRIAAESGVDYAISQLNEAAASQLPCPIDPGAALSKVSLLPALYQSNPNIQVQIQVRRLSAADWTAIKSYSSLYSAQLDPLNLAPVTASTAYNSPTHTTVDVDYWRIVEVTARRGSFSRSVRVILEPRFDPPPNGGGPTANGYKPFFSNSFFANSLIQTNPGSGKNLTITGGSAFDTGSGWAYPLTMQTNQLANIGSGTQLMGNLKVSNGTMGAPAAVAIGPALDGTSGIHGLLNTNSSVSNFSNLTPAPTASNPATDNVLADADLSNPANASSIRSSPNDVPIDTANGGNPLGVTPTQVNTSSVPLPDLGSLATSNSSLPAGNYVTGSLNTQGFSQGVTLGSGATNIYIADGASQSAAVDISSAMFNNAGSALNLQIWYSGTRPVNLDLSAGTNFNGIIYAPNAPITVTGTGGFQGALNGDRVYLNNSTANSSLQMQILTSINSVNGQPPPGAAPGYAVNAQGNPEIQGYKPVTWQESNIPFVGP